MTTIQEKNRVIAEFMGYEFDSSYSIYRKDLYRWHEDEVKFNSSWDWLMPVVEKIEGLGFQAEIDLFSCYIIDSSKLLDKDAMVIESHEDNKINAVYEAVSQFTIWHNQQSKTIES